MRIDALLFKEGVFPSRTKATQAVSEGKVLYNGKPAKPSLDVDDLSRVTVLDKKDAFVSNGGYKLQKAIDDFKISVKGLSFADIGASNGGFTDCLIKNGASKVFAIDVGESQLDEALLNDSRVIVKDNTNARYLTKNSLGECVDGVTADVSFISLTYILDGVKSVLKPNGLALLLIKPQFECGKEYLGNSGIVKSAVAREYAVQKIYNACYEKGLYPLNITLAPLREKKNIEYVIMLKNGDKTASLSSYEILNKIR